MNLQRRSDNNKLLRFANGKLMRECCCAYYGDDLWFPTCSDYYPRCYIVTIAGLTHELAWCNGVHIVSAVGGVNIAYWTVTSSYVESITLAYDSGKHTWVAAAVFWFNLAYYCTQQWEGNASCGFPTDSYTKYNCSNKNDNCSGGCDEWEDATCVVSDYILK